jgi:hypothetical protein
MLQRIQTRLLVGAIASFVMSSAASAAATVYFGLGKAYVLDLEKQGRTAHVATTLGAADGTYVDADSTRTITLANPIKASIDYQVPGCFIPGTADRYIQQVIFRQEGGTPRRGQSAVVDIGFDIITAGCNVGARVPFGSPSDAGVSLSHLAMTARPSMKNVRPGTTWAGLHWSPYVPLPAPFVIADAVDYLSTGEVRFLSSGLLVSSTMTADGWWALSLARGERRYTRLTKPDDTGGELWLFGDFADGRLKWAHAWWVIRRDATAAFGDVVAVSRQWADQRDPGHVYTNLYPDLTADRYIFSTQSSTWWRDIGWKWTVSANEVSMRKTLPNGPLLRTWSPIKTDSGYQWVLDQTVSNPDTSLARITHPRQLVRFNDGGPAVVP